MAAVHGSSKVSKGTSESRLNLTIHLSALAVVSPTATGNNVIPMCTDMYHTSACKTTNENAAYTVAFV